MPAKPKQPANAADGSGSKRPRVRAVKRITTPGDQAQSGSEAPVQGRTVKYKGEGPPAR